MLGLLFLLLLSTGAAATIAECQERLLENDVAGYTGVDQCRHAIKALSILYLVQDTFSADVPRVHQYLTKDWHSSSLRTPGARK